MNTKKFCVRENDGALEDYHEITFLFDSNGKGADDKVNQSDFSIKLQLWKIFIPYYRMTKKCWSIGETMCFR